ncbi:hypothetical protein [Streptomyces sp. NPDC004579]|uniref:hypothetical protein n=1 Tax=Streptomyces sp. NPDC004579 TaxID=3154667 RepID=UPI0033BFAAC7
MEIAVGYVFAWLVGKARRVAGWANAEADRGLDAGMEHVHDLISRRIGQDPGLERALATAQEEAIAGRVEPSEETRRQLGAALAQASAQDPAFAAVLKLLIDGHLPGPDASAKPGHAVNIVSGGTQYGPVVQGETQIGFQFTTNPPSAPQPSAGTVPAGDEAAEMGR